mgnify:FL=1
MPKVVESKVKVRFEECDFYQHVNNSVYNTYLDVGIGDFFRQLFPDLRGMTYMIHKVHASVDYMDSATFEDELIIKTSIEKLGDTSITFYQEIDKGDTVILKAKMIFVVMDYKTGQKCPIPKELADLSKVF